MKAKDTVDKLDIPKNLRDVPVEDLDELLDEDEDNLKVPRSGKRQLMPIERLR